MSTLLKVVQGAPGAQRKNREVAGECFTENVMDEEDSARRKGCVQSGQRKAEGMPYEDPEERVMVRFRND